MRGERSSTSPDMSRLVVLPPEHGASAYLNIRCRDERSGRECLQRGLNLTTNKRTKMGVRASPVRGRGGGCAEAPLAGSSPSRAAIPDAKRGRGRAHGRNCYSSRQQHMHIRFRTCSLSVYRSGRTLSFAEPVVSMRRNPLRTHRHLRRHRGERTPLVRSCRSWWHRLADAKFAISQTHASGEGTRSRMGFPWFRRGLLRSTREGFATRACDLFGFACEVTAAAPEHVGACRAGMVPAARREPFNVAQSYARSEPRLRSGPHADGAGHPFPG